MKLDRFWPWFWSFAGGVSIRIKIMGIVLVLILIIFGVGKLPQVGGAIGKGLREFRKGQRGEDEDKREPKLKKVATGRLAKS